MEDLSSPLLYRTKSAFSLRTLRIEEKFHCRAEFASNAIALRQLLEEGTELEPMTVVLPESDAEDWDYDRSPLPILIDGFDRYYAYSGMPEGLDQVVPVEVLVVRDGVDLDRAALLLSLSANISNRVQKPRTRADKRKAVTTILLDAEWREFSDRAIAVYLGVSNGLVGDIRDRLEERSLIPPRGNFKSQNGKTFHIEVDLSDRIRCHEEVQAILVNVPTEKHEQVIDLAWQVQQQSGGGLVEPDSYREAIARLEDGRAIDRAEAGSYARARDGQKLLRTITATRQHLDSECRIQAIELITEEMGEEELARVYEILAVRRQMAVA